MNGVLCKIFRFFLNIFEKVVEVVASAVKTIGTAVVDVLGTLLEATGNALSGLLSGSGVLGFVAGGLLLLWLIKDDEKGKDGNTTTPSVNKSDSTGAVSV